MASDAKSETEKPRQIQCEPKKSVSNHFIYLLNALERSGHANPFEAGYPIHRAKLLAYVEQLELIAYAASELEWPESEQEFDIVSILANAVVDLWEEGNPNA